MRNEEGDVIFACVREIQENSNTAAEEMAILEALRYCVAIRYTHILLQMDCVTKECDGGKVELFMESDRTC